MEAGGYLRRERFRRHHRNRDDLRTSGGRWGLLGTAERGGGGADLRETPTSRGTGLQQGVEPSKAHGAEVLRGLFRGVSALLWGWAKFSKQNWKGGAEPT